MRFCCQWCSHCCQSKRRRALLFALVVVTLLISVPAGRAQAQTPALPWLHTDGVSIVDEQGRAVTLKGFNLGGWMVEEMWMMSFQTKAPAGSGYKDITDHVTLWNTLQQRLGADAMLRVRTALRKAWITEADFQRIGGAGFNAVRLPFTYDLLQEDGGRAWLDQALDWGRAHGVYVILDLHGAPGRQSGEHHTGEAGVNRLFKDPEMVRQTVAVWTQIAQRYRDRPEVAAYDLLNEPTGAPEASTLHLVHEQLYRAVRAVDPKHIVILEDGYKGPDSLPHPDVLGWSNVMFSVHSYNFHAKTAQDQLNNLKSLSSAWWQARERHAPIYLGEFNLEPEGGAVAGDFVRALQEHGWSWTWWTYKVAPIWSGSTWGWFVANPSMQALDPFRDSEVVLLRKIEQLRTSNLHENTKFLADLRGAMAVAAWHDTPVQGWRWHLDNRGEAAAREWAALGVKTDTPEWHTANGSEDVFANKPGFAWYRTTLPLVPAAHHTLSFEAVDDNATVYLNGKQLLHHEGYNEPFEVTLDPAWRAAGPNEVAVLVQNDKQGGGIKGDVLLRTPAG